MIREDDFVIETPVVDLYCPKKRKEKVRIEKVSGDIQMVQFFATLEGKTEIHLFDICFAGEEGYIKRFRSIKAVERAMKEN